MSLSATSTGIWNASRDGDSTTSLDSLFQRLITLSVRKFFLDIQSKPPMEQLEAVSPCPMACSLGEEPDTHLATASFQGAAEAVRWGLPEPPPLQTKHPQFPRLRLTRLVLQTLHQLRCSLDMLQHLQVFLEASGPNVSDTSLWKTTVSQWVISKLKGFPSPY